MSVQRAPEKALSISVRPAVRPVATTAKAPAITFDVYTKAPRDGAPETAPVAEPFKNPKNYVQAVEHAEALLKSFRAELAGAQQRKAQAEAQSGAKLSEVVAARDAKQAEASKPLNAAKAAQEAKRRELQKPIDDTSAKLAEAKADLEIATFPNKRELDKARNAAHSDVASKQNSLNSAQSRLDNIVSQIARDESDLSSNRSGLAQARANAVVIGANLMSARDEYERARWDAPSQWDWDQMQRSLRSAETGYDAQMREVSDLRDRVADRRRALDRLLREETDRPTPPPVGGSDRPTPPAGGSDRPTPPAGNSGRPTPPSGSSDRPTPPSGSSDRPTPPSGTGDRPTPPAVRDGDSDEISRARSALASAERDLDYAVNRADELEREVQNIRRRYNDMERKWSRMERATTNVNAFERELLAIQQNMTTYQNNITTLERRISEYGAAKPGAIQDRDRATSALRNSQAYAAKLDNTPYDKGDASKIQGAQATVNSIAAQLAKYREAYTAGMKAPTERTAKEQATFDTAMAPFEQAVQDAQAGKANAVANAQREVDGAQSKVDQGSGELNRLKTGVSGWKKFWWGWPKWLFGSGFSVSKFWKDRPAA